MVDTTLIVDRVNNGINLLDDMEPDWRNKVNKNTMRIQSVDNCVLKQVYPDRAFHISLEVLGIKDAGIPYGFSIDEPDKEYIDVLQAEWLRRLN
jgi:orotate phosphoribosyltransferase-like protein